MGRKSTKQARYDAMSQRGQKRHDKAKLLTKRNDAKDWTDKVLTIIKAEVTKEATQTKTTNGEILL